MAAFMVLVAAFAAAFLLTGLMRRYALAMRLLDVPNARSSHQVPTPRGGGLAMVVAFFAVLLGVSLLSGVARDLVLALLPALLLVSLVGFWDDHRELAPGPRILAHFLAAAWAVYWLGGEISVVWPHGFVGLGATGAVVAVFALVWFLNLFNFMDGIDGIAAGQAVFLGFAGAGLVAWSGPAEVALGLALIGAVALGFLVWNWPPAKIFMGDVGSGFLGASIGLLAYAGVLADGATLWAWLILLALFVTDGTLTLLQRVRRGERPSQAHRSHAYQHAARRWGHRRVTLGALLVNLFWLLPLAVLALLYPGGGVALTALAYVPLLVLALRLGAGRREPG